MSYGANPPDVTEISNSASFERSTAARGLQDFNPGNPPADVSGDSNSEGHFGSALLPFGAMGRRLRSHLLNLFFPRCCVHCGCVPGSCARRSSGHFLCSDCRGLLVFSPRELCSSCGSPGLEVGPDGAGAEQGPIECRRCGERRRRGAPSRLDGVSWCWAYAPPISTAITAMKFRGLDYLADWMAGAAVDHLRDRWPVLDVLVPVPLHWSRRWARGYDQADLVAAGLSKRLGMPKKRWLYRRRRTSAQSRLSEVERHSNLASAFRVRRGAPVHGQRILLVDDVVTTGATLEAAAEALWAAGAESVHAITVARTPQPNETEVSSMPD